MDPEVIAKVAEHKIQEAIDEGKFDNLPGKGKPLVFDDDPMTPAHLRLANKVLKNANVLPEWMQAQHDLNAEQQEVNRLLERTRHEYITRREKSEVSARAAHQFTEWHTKTRTDYLRLLKSVNTGILKLSLTAPSTVQPGKPYKVDQEMEAFDAEFPPLHGVSPSTPNASAREANSQLRGIAKERYATGGGPVLGWSKQAKLHRSTPIAPTESEDIRTQDAPTEK